MGIGRSRLINMNGPEADLVKQFIQQNEIAIFSKKTCPFCKMAKEVSKTSSFFLNIILFYYFKIIFRYLIK